MMNSFIGNPCDSTTDPQGGLYDSKARRGFMRLTGPLAPTEDQRTRQLRIPPSQEGA